MSAISCRFIGFVLIIFASLLISDGLYIKFKAVFAQHLLQRAWQQSLDRAQPVKPWPWADTWPVARLRVERLGVDCIVLEGESGEVLAFGPGHLSGSTPPAAEGNCALVGHRDTSMSFLADIEKGDILTLQNVGDEQRRYEVVSTVVKKQQELLVEETVTPWLTLITCYPFHSVASGDLRFVVFAREHKTLSGELAEHKAARLAYRL
ncbi:MAG TPA: class GN sortase [Desulfopila sp.]|nr:class GN sortase [Desulfopila sp.]